MEKQNSINLEYSVELKDCIKFNLYRLFTPFRIIAFIVLNAGLIYFIYSEIKSIEPDVNEIIWLCLFPFFTLVLPVMIIFATMKNYKTNAFIKETQHYSIQDNKVEISSASGTAVIEWEKIYKVKETGKFFYVYISKSRAFLIAKKAFSHEDDIKKFKGILTMNIEKKKLKLIA